ncbi:hypothetical protein D3C77_375380 [compost metagenome]
MSRINDHFHQAQNRWIVWLVQVRDALVHPVSSHRVLNQIIRTDAEEVYFLGKLISQYSGRWNFHHDADLNFFGDGHTFCCQFFLFFKQ